MDFSELGISEEVVKATKDCKYDSPTPIQEFAIPRILDGLDIIAQSATGSGKTATFGLPMIDRISKGDGVQGLIVVPTRELAEQISRELTKFSKHKGLRVTVVYGGVGMNPQIRDIAAADIVVATPGRLLDHYYNGSINLDNVSILVLDEADRMLDMGFIDDVQKIIKSTPSERQTLMFGATLPLPIIDLAKAYMKDPKKITASTHVGQEYLDQYFFNVEVNEKFSVLVHTLQNDNPARAIIFTGTRRNADAVSHNLNRQGLKAECLHGGMSQNKRTDVLDGFYAGKLPILVATDVASRGLDIKEVSHVINYDIPKQPEDYVHRIGRTARAGATGIAYSILSPPDFDNFRRVEAICPTPIKRVDNVQFRKVPFDSGKGQRRGFGGERGSFGGRGGFRDGPGRRLDDRRGSFGGRGRPQRGFDRRDSSQGYSQQAAGGESPSASRAARMGKDW